MAKHSNQINLWLETELYEALDKISVDINFSKQYIIRALLRKYIRGEVTLDDGYQFCGRYTDEDGITWAAYRPWRT